MATRDDRSSQRVGFKVALDKIFLKNFAEPLRISDVTGYQCCVCRYLLRQAHQTSCCGTRMCKSCLDRLRSKHGKAFACPDCKSTIGDGSDDELSYVFPDHSCNKDMKSLYTVCHTIPKPCDWRGPVIELEKHLQVCDYAEMGCTLGCGSRMTRRQLKTHLLLECLMRIVDCEHCKKQIKVNYLQEHLLECDERKEMDCPFCAAADFNSKAELLQHVHGGSCSKVELSCPMKEALGCTVKVRPLELTRHVVKHLQDIVRLNDTRDKEVRGEIMQLTEALRQQQARIMDGALAARYEQEIAVLNQKVDRQSELHRKELQQLSLRLDAALARFGSEATATAKPSSSTAELLHIENRLRVLQTNQDHLEQQLTDVNGKLTENSDIVGTLQNSIDQCTRAITTVNGVLNEVGLKVDILAVRSTNGILIWKVNDVAKRIEDARSGRILSLYSPPFFTSLHGYRMCLRLYLDGDGQGKGTHVSLFLVIMQSDYDDLLSWPFKQKVTLYLLNQREPFNTKAHVAQAFRPTESSSSFQKPHGPFNTASGFPKFSLISKLQERDFVQDNCMYFKVKVDLTDLKAPDYPVY